MLITVIKYIFISDVERE